MQPSLIDATDAAKLLDVPRSRIYAWRHRGLINPSGITPAKTPLYRVDDLKPLAERYHQRHAQTTTPAPPVAQPTTHGGRSMPAEEVYPQQAPTPTKVSEPLSSLAFTPPPECTLCSGLGRTPTTTGWRRCRRCQGAG